MSEKQHKVAMVVVTGILGYVLFGMPVVPLSLFQRSTRKNKGLR